MNLIQKISLYRQYKRAIKQNKVTLNGDFGVRIDRASRLYTVLNIPSELYGEPYNLRKGDIDTISQAYIKEYVQKLSLFLNSIGLSEIYDFYEPIKKIDKYSYLIVLGFKQMNSVEYNKIIWYRVVPIITILSLSLLIYLLN